MADENVAIADLLPALSPLDDPETAALDRKGTMEKLLGPAPEPAWYEQGDDEPAAPEPQQAAAPRSQNGNALPPGLINRDNPQQSAPATPAAPAPAVPASVTPTGDASTSGEAAANTAFLQQMRANSTKNFADVDAEASAPSQEQATRVQEQMVINARQRQNSDANPYLPIDPNHPDKQVMKPEYKPSLGQRIMRGVGGMQKGGILGVVDPEGAGATAYGAPNKEYGVVQQQNAGKVAGADQQLTNAQANYKEMLLTLQARAKDRAEAAKAAAETTTASNNQQNIPINQTKADAEAQQAKNNTPASKGAAVTAEIDARKAEGVAIGLKGAELERYSLGKTSEQFAPNAEIVANSQALAAWKHDHPNQVPGVNDIRDIQAAARGGEIKNSGAKLSGTTAQKIIDEKNAAMNKATQQYRDKMDKSGGSYTQTDWVNDMQAAQDAYEESIVDHGGTVKHMTIDPQGRWTVGESKEDAAAAPASSTPNLQADGSWEGIPKQAGEVAVTNPDGLPGYVPQAKLKAALKAGYKQPKAGK
jgi:hypothetical protein